ncbi:glycosyl hydrolase family 8 [Sphingobium estronivorans]|uniref:glycosyl hydrolase family 8 n=1 Tax=Sphingobium estronivorans TaxID=1577690 RepID=UPI00123958DE|nr:glycosyl hydrolase family 8 [Sphingobium estronivorans]
MAVDRRTFALGSLAALTGSCARAGERRLARGDSDLMWPQFKARFLDPTGRVVDNGNGGISHSEGQGYGLWLALWADDRNAFDAMLRWTEATLARKDIALYSWRYDPRQPDPVADRNNATDGDIFIAWALARAAETWREPAYARRSEEIRAAILAHLVVERFGRNVLLPGLDGFSSPNLVTVNPSYIIWPALDRFRSLDGSSLWGPLIADSEHLLSAARFGPRQLPTDWVDIAGANSIVPAASKPPRFGFDAIRIPLYALASGRQPLVSPIIDYWRDYRRRGSVIPAWIDIRSGEEADYGLSPGGIALADRSLGLKNRQPLANDYYAAALQMLAKSL